MENETVSIKVLLAGIRGEKISESDRAKIHSAALKSIETLCGSDTLEAYNKMYDKIHAKKGKNKK